MAWMAGLYRHPPLFVVEGSGASFTDVDGNTYLDMNQADLSMNCGYGPPSVVKAGAQRLLQGSQFLLPTEDAIATAGPAASFTHTHIDIDRYLAVLDTFLEEIT